ncbi:hypothetical protein SAMN06265375_101421 [Muriicola jejuensis]|uniref:Uncharacterized protein n=1 Tax=Muriicola jejuensis TaxID=504488 RepID=A0A6P0UAI2_9FLAO|nr:hypothetical protein [Muriicola jejuensis]NER10047.1 hypothetical protein [Muriicola jejuensis]SMP03437.1 hypothetical protein SAMN06265375_101421 [Muriicola jejuensis]
MSSSHIHSLRQNLKKAEKALFFEKQKQKKVEQRQAALDRYFDPKNTRHQKLQASLSLQQKKLQDNVKDLKDAYGNRLGLYESAWEALLPDTDPSRHLNKLDAHFPIIMLPLRLETRFKRSATNTVDQLWVRVFPDDCAVDSFEESLSLAELKNAQNFWSEWVAAGVVETKMRGAWRSLTESHGAGRAQYLINHYRPINLEDLMPDAQQDSEEVILAIAVPFGTIIEAEKQPIRDYWLSAWKSNGQVNSLNQALQDLVNSLGEDRTKAVLEQHVPINFDDNYSHIQDRNQASITLKFVEFPDEESLEVGYQQRTWSHPPKVRVFPERFYLVGYRAGKVVLKKLGNVIPLPLICGPDPLEEQQELVDLFDGDLKVSPGMKWMVDFQEAVGKGMGFVVTKKEDAQLILGYDRLMVVGVRITAEKEEGKALTEELFTHHYYGNSGFRFLPVGTPTNNIQGAPSGYTEREDADDSFDAIFKSADDPLQEEHKDWWSGSDRAWFNTLLGLSKDFLADTAHTNGYDQRQARAINTALWPATLGYFFESMMQPIFTEKEQKDLRHFFNFFVTARGTIPSIRIDDQPYGILPTTAFSKIRWYNNDINPSYHVIDERLSSTFGFYGKMHSFFLTMQAHWKNMAKDVPHVHMAGDPDQILLDVLGHHGGSVEYHSRIGQSLNHLWNLYQLAQEQSNGVSAYEAAHNYYDKYFETLLGRLLLYHDFNYKGQTPEILEKYFSETALKLDELIHDQPLSEQSGIRSYTTDDRNYIEWLIDAASTSFDILKKEKEGFIDGKKPRALLYTLLQHALEMGYFETGLKLYQEAELISLKNVQKLKTDPDFIGIRDFHDRNDVASKDRISVKSLDGISLAEKKFSLLEQNNATVTGVHTMNIAQYITFKLKEVTWKSAYVNQQIRAMEHLKDVSSAALERLLAEHLDCASYRFDAWKWGFINAQLLATRKQESIPSSSGGLSPDGLYLGAYGWLEDLRPDTRTLEKVTFKDNQLKEIFGDADLPQLMKDSSNLGYIQAPSLNHAVTASILRNAYLARADKENPELYNINLSSERVRKALAVIEGIQNGQNLAAVLGYQFERFIHDSTSAEVDYLIFPLRRQFPLVSDQMASTQTGDADYTTAPIEALEARNVIHGSSLIDFVQQRLGPSGEPNYLDDFDLQGLNDAEKAILVKAIDHIRDTNDALADLGLAESIHQVVQGNIDRAAGTLDTYSKGNHPQVPDVIQTPRSGVNLTHRVGIQLNPKAAAGAGASPRAKSEPAINEYLTTILPKLKNIICSIDISNQDLGLNDTLKVKMESLGISPIDLLYIVSDDSEQAMTLLDDLLVMHILENYNSVGNVKLRPDTSIKINYYIPVKDADEEVSVFELMPLLRHLRALLLGSRPLRPSDVSLPNETSEKVDSSLSLDVNRITGAYAALKAIHNPDNPNPAANPLLKLEMDLRTLLDADQLNAIVPAAENLAQQLLGYLNFLAMFGIPHVGMGFIYGWKKEQIQALLGLAHQAKDRFAEREKEYNVLIEQIVPGMSQQELIQILVKAELKISTVATINPNPATFKNDVTVVQKGKFDTAKQKILDFIAGYHQTVLEALTVFKNDIITDYDKFDREIPETAEVQKAFKILTQDLYTRVSLIRKELDKRYARYDELLISHSNQTSMTAQAELVQEMGKTLFSEDFKMIPSFSLLTLHQEEWSKAMAHQNELLDYLINVEGNPLPVDDWMYGVSKVREKIGHLEQTISLAEAFSEISIELTPAQFPYVEPYGWLAMEFGHADADKHKQMLQNYKEHDHLLYTACYHTPYNANEKQCGILIDEWTEVIPTEEETTGTAFHYDKPNSEAPQNILLVCSPQVEINWQWNDLLDALNETLDEAKLRGVEPEQIDKTGYSSFLPATLSAFTTIPITAIANYATSSYAYMNLVTQQNNE